MSPIIFTVKQKKEDLIKAIVECIKMSYVDSEDILKTEIHLKENDLKNAGYSTKENDFNDCCCVVNTLKQDGLIKNLQVFNPEDTAEAEEYWEMHDQQYPGFFIFNITDKFKNEFGPFGHKQPIKIEFHDGELIDVKNNKKIHQYSQKNKAYHVCQCIFNPSKGMYDNNGWIHWDEIDNYINDDASDYGKKETDSRKKAISDAVCGINKHALKIIGENIISTDGKQRYQTKYQP